MVGAILSTAKLNAFDAVLLFPAISVKRDPITEIDADAVLFVLATKFAVYLAPLPVKPLKLPPLTLISSTVKLREASLKPNVRIADVA
jgi:hypothetical protein